MSDMAAQEIWQEEDTDAFEKIERQKNHFVSRAGIYSAGFRHGMSYTATQSQSRCEPSDKAMHIAARIWCDPQMEEYIMDVGLAHEIACMIESRVITPKET